MPEKSKQLNNTILKPDFDRLTQLYSILGQVLDGVWFLETEKRVGFEKALEIDLAVWEDFAARETQRILGILTPEPEKLINSSSTFIFNILEQILKISLFNQSITYEIERSNVENSLIFKVTNCKALTGMGRVGRPMNQVQRICKDIGLAYYLNMAKILHPDLKVECLTIPTSFDLGENVPRCAWKFYFE